MAEVWVKGISPIFKADINYIAGGGISKTRVFRVLTTVSATIYLRLHLALSFIRADGPKKIQ